MTQPNSGKGEQEKAENPRSTNKSKNVNQKSNPPVRPAVTLEQKIDKLGDFSLNMLRSIALWRLFGYLLLFLFILDLGEIFIPPRFFDPEWEFQAIGQVVERVPIPIISVLLIFYGGKYLRKSWEYIFLTFISWMTLIVGILFIVSVPLGVINTMRINDLSNKNITQGADQQLEVLQQVENTLGQVTQPQQMQALIARLNNGNAPVIENQQQLENAKNEVRTIIERNRNQIDSQLRATKKRSRRRLLKRSVKWNLGALVSGVLFVTTWKMTKWARKRESINEV